MGCSEVPYQAAQKLANNPDASTLGTLLNRLKGKGTVQIDDALKERFASALKARNKLSHGFYERHNFRMQTDERARQDDRGPGGASHQSIREFSWQIAQAMMKIATDHVKEHATEKI